jgi:hypothetical protein
MGPLGDGKSGHGSPERTGSLDTEKEGKMIQNEKARMAVNRILSFLVGGLLVYVVLTLTVVSGVKRQNEQLAKQLDTSQYEPSRLLADAKAQFADRDFAKVMLTATDLLDKRPGSSQAAEAKGLYENAKLAMAADNANWEAAVSGIRDKWAQEMTAQLRAQSEKTRLEMEKGLDDTLNKEWEKMKEQVRVEWTKQQS